MPTFSVTGTVAQAVTTTRKFAYTLDAWDRESAIREAERRAVADFSNLSLENTSRGTPFVQRSSASLVQPYQPLRGGSVQPTRYTPARSSSNPAWTCPQGTEVYQRVSDGRVVCVAQPVPQAVRHVGCGCQAVTQYTPARNW